MEAFYPKLVMSGGQTGVDRGALYAARQLGYEHGGWATLGRKAEDGRVPDCFPMTECSSTGYPSRTRLNVECSDATLLFGYEEPSGGTALTIRIAEELHREHLFLRIEPGANDMETSHEVRRWLARVRPRVLNVAGQRESRARGIEEQVKRIMLYVLQRPENCLCGRAIPQAILASGRVARCGECGHTTRIEDLEPFGSSQM